MSIKVGSIIQIKRLEFAEGDSEVMDRRIALGVLPGDKGKVKSIGKSKAVITMLSGTAKDKSIEFKQCEISVKDITEKTLSEEKKLKEKFVLIVDTIKEARLYIKDATAMLNFVEKLATPKKKKKRKAKKKEVIYNSDYKDAISRKQRILPQNLGGFSV